MANDKTTEAESLDNAAEAAEIDAQTPAAPHLVATTRKGVSGTPSEPPVAEADEDDPAPESSSRPKAGPEPEAKEKTELPSFEEVKAEIEAVEKGNNKSLGQFVHNHFKLHQETYFTRDNEGSPKGGAGWALVAIEEDNDVVTVEQSRELAGLVNNKIDCEQMNRETDKKSAKRKRRAEKQRAEAEELATLMKGATVKIEGSRNMQEFATNIDKFEALELLEVTEEENGRLKIVAITDKKGSEELVAVANTKKDELKAKKAEKEKRMRRVPGILRAIEGKNDSTDLRGLAEYYDEIEALKFKEISGGKDYVVTPYKGKTGSLQICNQLMDRKAYLERKELEDTKAEIAALGE